MGMEQRCIHCGFPIQTLFLQYSPGNIRLLKCENCKAVADEYIECEIMILLIDLILHKPKAYRHLLFNLVHPQTFNSQGLLWKSALGFLLLDAYMILVLTRSNDEWRLSTSFSSLFWRGAKILMNALFGNLAFLSIFLLATRNLMSTFGGASRYKNLLLTILISSYFKIFLITMMIWEFPSFVIFIIDAFVLSSNTVALKALKVKKWVSDHAVSQGVIIFFLVDIEAFLRAKNITKVGEGGSTLVTSSGLSRCAVTCFIAHAVKLFLVQLAGFHSSKF